MAQQFGKIKKKLKKNHGTRKAIGAVLFHCTECCITQRNLSFISPTWEWHLVEVVVLPIFSITFLT